MTTTATLAVSGLVGGVAATVVMTVLMNVLGDDSPPPTALLYHRFLGSEDASPGDYLPQGMALHFLYGIGAGVALGVGGGALAVGIGPGAVATSLAAGVVWGLVLFVVGTAFWMNVVLGFDGDRATLLTMGAFHLAYGVVLGAALGLVPALA